MIKTKEKHSKAGLKERRRKLTNDILKTAMGYKTRDKAGLNSGK